MNVAMLYCIIQSIRDLITVSLFLIIPSQLVYSPRSYSSFISTRDIQEAKARTNTSERVIDSKGVKNSDHSSRRRISAHANEIGDQTRDVCWSVMC